MKKKQPSLSWRARWIVSTCVGSLVLASFFSSAQAQIQLVADINKELSSSYSEFGRAVQSGTIVYVSANNALWRTDGTQEGSAEIKKFNSIRRMISYNAHLVFVANDGVHGSELWKSDGTPEGTTLIKDLVPGTSSPVLTSFVVANNLLFFVATTPEYGTEIWRTDGTPSGTFILKDIIKGPKPSNPTSLVAFQDKVFFSASDGLVGYELWSTDGTSSGTSLFKDIRPGKTGSGPGSLIVSGSRLFFHALDDINGRELWASDGTLAGTAMVKAIRPGVNSSPPENMIDVNGVLYFLFNDDNHGREFWRSDGTAAGTQLAFELVDGPNGIHWFFHGAFSAGGKIYIHTGRDLLESDGTQEGTKYYMELGDYYNGVNTWIFNDVLYFLESEVDWDDYTKSTHRLVKIENSVYTPIYTFTGAESGPSLNYTALLGLVFSYQTSEGKVMLWKSDGTTEGTVPFMDVIDYTKGSMPSSLIQFDGNIIFSAVDSATRRSLWKMDGSTTDAELISPITPYHMTLSGNRIYFVTSAGQLWKTNGTSQGTMLVKRFEGSKDVTKELTDVNGTLFFAARTGTGDRELWKSNGNYASTVRVKDIYKGSGSSNPMYLTKFRNEVYFSANSAMYGQSLWKSDGTDAGTVAVLPPDAQYFHSPASLAAGTDWLYFVGRNNITGVELYKTDGTGAGTGIVKDIRANDNGTNDVFYGDDIVNLKTDGNRVYFMAKSDNGTFDAWTSDGTSEGTYMLLDLPWNSNVTWLSSYKGRMFFIKRLINEGIAELWSTDGTVENTMMVKALSSIYGGRTSVILDNILYFEGTSNSVWRTDGTACGTFVIPANGMSLSNSESPAMIVSKDRRIVFSAFSPYTGDELFKVEKANLPKSPCPVVFASDENLAAEIYETNGLFDDVVATHPNPFVRELTLRVDGDEASFDAVFISTNGRTVSSLNGLETNRDHVVGNHLQKGVYLLKVTLGNKSIVKRIVKID
jgi:ELWxxDGT repeat protein